MKTNASHPPKLDRALARLQQAIGAGQALPDLQELAAAAHLSPFHFHRVWRALTGETVGPHRAAPAPAGGPALPAG